MRDHANVFFLFRQLVGRELAARYRATTLGLLWLVLQPLLMLGAYTLVFSGIFQIRWGGAETNAGFALVLFSGLIVFNLFAEVLVSSPALITAQPNYVKKVVFPLELLGFVRVAAALFSAMVGLAILLVAQWVIAGVPSPWFALAPFVLLEMLPMLLGIAWFVSALSVYLQDLAHLAGVLASVMLFISPIFFPPSAIPPRLTALIQYNPLVIPLEQLRALTVQNGPPDWLALASHLAVSCLFAFLAYKVFRRLSPGFADVL